MLHASLATKTQQSIVKPGFRVANCDAIPDKACPVTRNLGRYEGGGGGREREKCPMGSPWTIFSYFSFQKYFDSSLIAGLKTSPKSPKKAWCFATGSHKACRNSNMFLTGMASRHA